MYSERKGNRYLTNFEHTEAKSPHISLFVTETSTSESEATTNSDRRDIPERALPQTIHRSLKPLSIKRKYYFIQTAHVLRRAV
jgi:hypothetical protein